MKLQPFEHPTLSSIDVDWAMSLSQYRVMIETFDPCRFLKPTTDDDAEWAVGKRYLLNDANEKIADEQRAIECFMRGAQLRNVDCMHRLVSCYESVCGVTQGMSNASGRRAKAQGII